jgi:peptide/nickel transport system substrate-binding protein
LQAQWAKNGQGAVATTIKPVEYIQGLGLKAQGQFDLWGAHAGPSDNFDPDSCFRTYHHTGAGRNYGGYSDPKLDEMMDKQRTMFDVAQRKAAIKDMLTYMMDSCPTGGFASFFTPNAIHNNVQSYWPNPSVPTWAMTYDQVWFNS